MKTNQFFSYFLAIVLLSLSSKTLHAQWQTSENQMADTIKIPQEMLTFHETMANNMQRSGGTDKVYTNVSVVGPLTNSDQYFYVDTKIPFIPESAPQIHINGFNYAHSNKAVSLTLGWYNWNNNWYWAQYRCNLGYYNPSRIRLGTYNDAGTTRVRIEIANDGIYWTSYFFSATDIIGDASYYEDWTYHTGSMPSGTGNIITVDEYGYINIGSATSPATLNVTGNIVGTGAYICASSIGRSGSHYDEFGYNIGFTSTNDVYNYRFNDPSASIRMGWNGAIEFRTAPSGNSGAPLILTERMRILENGNVGIGTTIPTSKLTVAGTITAREVNIEANAGADFVFAPDYRLRPLPEVEQFITANKHLPDIAPADSMAQNGVNMGEMQIKLLQKIEELTLYVIEQQKQIQRQEENHSQQINVLRREMEALKRNNQ